MAFMSKQKEELLAGSMLEMLEHSQASVRTVALDTLKQAIIRREAEASGSFPQMKTVIFEMAQVLELAEEHKERVLAHDMAGCD